MSNLSSEEIDRLIDQNTARANWDVGRAFASGYVASVGQVDRLIDRNTDSAGLAVGWAFVGGYVASVDQIDSLIEQNTDSADLAVAQAFAAGYVASADQIDRLIDKNKDSANLAVARAFAAGYVASVDQVDRLIEQNTYRADRAIEQAFEGSDVMVECGKVGSGEPMTGYYKSLPNGHGVLETRLMVRAEGALFVGDDPVTQIRDSITDIPEDRLPGMRDSINAGLDRIVAARPGGQA